MFLYHIVLTVISLICLQFNPCVGFQIFKTEEMLQEEGQIRDQTIKMALPLIVGQIRRILSAAAVEAQVQCLLARLHQVGPGNKQLAKRRQWAVLQDEKMKKERHSQED